MMLSSSSSSSSSSYLVRCCLSLSTFQRGGGGGGAQRRATTCSNLRIQYQNQNQQQQKGCCLSSSSSSLLSSSLSQLNINEQQQHNFTQQQKQYQFHSSIHNNNNNNNNLSILLRQQTSRLSLGTCTANTSTQQVQLQQNQYFSTLLRIQGNTSTKNSTIDPRKNSIDPRNRISLLDSNNIITTKRTFASKRHKRLLKYAKGFRGRSKNCFTIAIRRVERSWEHAKVDRKLKHRLYRKLWIMKIQAATRIYNISYSRFIPALIKSNILLNRKVLASLASHEPFSFKSIIDVLTTQGTVQINNPQNYTIPTTIIGRTTDTDNNDDGDGEDDTVPKKYRR